MIRIADHVRTFSSYGDGEVIYQLIAADLRKSRVVTLSFSGIKSIPSAFVNAALVKLIEEFEFDFIRSHLIIVDSTRQINRIIKDRFYFATKERAAVG